MLFLSTYINKIDKKGRVSIPVSFRSGLGKDDFSGIIAYESINSNCIEACSERRIRELSEAIDGLDPYSEERDAFATIILGGSTKLSFDNEGRVLLPESLISFAKLEEQVCFVGKGQTFEIWNPAQYEAHYKAAKELAIKNRGLLRLSKNNKSLGI